MGYRSMGSCLLSSSVLVECWVVVVGGSSCFWVPLVDCPGLTSAWRASSFSFGEIPAAVPDGLSVPVVRSGNTGKSRFLGASLPVAVPIPFQDSRRAVPSGGAPFHFRSNRGRHGHSQGLRRQRADGDEGCSRGVRSARRGTVRRSPSALCSARRSAALTASRRTAIQWARGHSPTWSDLFRSRSGRDGADRNRIGVQLICLLELLSVPGRSQAHAGGRISLRVSAPRNRAEITSQDVAQGTEAPFAIHADGKAGALEAPDMGHGGSRSWMAVGSTTTAVPWDSRNATSANARAPKLLHTPRRQPSNSP